MIHILLMEFNTELILLSDNISTSINLPVRSTIHSNVSCNFYNYIELSIYSTFSLNDHTLFSYVENIYSNNNILNIIKKIETRISLSLANNLLINKNGSNCYIYLIRDIISDLKIYNSTFLSKVNLFDMYSNIAFKSVFSKGCLIPKIDVKSNLVVKYHNIIPRLVYNLIKINKRLLYFNNNFLAQKK